MGKVGKDGKPAPPFGLKYLVTIASSTVAESVTFPLDITKTRLQLQGQLGNKKAPYRGMFRTALGIIQEEGLFKLWKGLPPAVIRHMVYSGCRMTFYEYIRENIFKRNKQGKYPLWKAIPTGMISGAAAQFLASPTDLVKVQMQMEGRRQLEGKKPRYRGTFDAFRSILRESGIRGLWKGWAPNCQRAAIVCLGDLTTYDTAKQFILRNTGLDDNAFVHAMSSGCSGLVSATLGTPADVVKTRMMNQKYVNGRGVVFRSSFDCLSQTIKAEGVPALWKGFLPTWSRMAPWSLTFWLVYEEVRVLAGLGNF
ncbi:mitochondrial uncoupling protein 4-like [Dysidea avara]|uniref:mitochondrial uncoupling protein 4-like n=1 Tax=Dysidea avara TaxID=196820 RepID=UPI003331E81C